MPVQRDTIWATWSGRDHLFDHAGLAVLGFGFLQLLFQFGNLAIGQFTGALEFTLALGNGKFVARLVELLLEVGGQAQFLLLRLPLRGDLGRFLLQAGKLPLETGEPVL